MNGVVIAGGGTGGHIYPAVAVAQTLKKKRSDISIDFIGTRRGLETKIIPREGFPLHFIEIGALNSVGLVQKITTLLSLPWALFQSIKLLWKLKPKVVLGVGGYSSGPVMVAAILMRKRTALFESNAFPGLTNRLLARFSGRSFVNFEASRKFFPASRVEVVGMPIREGLKPSTRSPHDKFRVLVFGGSQGAHGINVTVMEAVKRGGSWLDRVELVHQVGSRDFPEFNAEYKKLAPRNVKWFEFLYDMPERYAWADLVVCRSGASTLAELSACKKASILVPFPFASDNHQLKNAEALEIAGAARIILQKDFTAEKFIETVSDAALNSSKLKSFEEKVFQFYKVQSSELMADYLVQT